MFGSKAKKRNKEYSKLVAACKEGNVEDVETLLGKGKAEINRRDDEDWTPLFWACFNGHLDIVKLLVNGGAAVQLMDKQGRSPLYLSSGWGGEEITSFLLQHNGDVTKCNQDGWNCLHLCAYRGKDSVVDLVLSAGCSLVQKDKQGRTPLDIAQKGNHKKVEDVLVRNAKKAILKASEEGNHALVNGLLELYKIDVNYADVTGWTPLHYAAKGGRVGIVKLLCSHGCEMELKNMAGKTPLEVAEHGNDAVRSTLNRLIEEKREKAKSQIMMAREEAAELLERKKSIKDSVDIRVRSSTAAPARPKNALVKPDLAIPAFERGSSGLSLEKDEPRGKPEADASREAADAASGDATTEHTSPKGQDSESPETPKEDGARLSEVLAQMKQAKAARQAKLAEQKKALMMSLSDEQKQTLMKRVGSPTSPRAVVLSPRLMIYDKEAMAEKEAREKKEKEEREAREAAEAAAKAEAEEQARIKAEEEALARLELPVVKRALAAEWTDIESFLDAMEIPYDHSETVQLLHLAQFELNTELKLYEEPGIETGGGDSEQDRTVKTATVDEKCTNSEQGSGDRDEKKETTVAQKEDSRKLEPTKTSEDKKGNESSSVELPSASVELPSTESSNSGVAVGKERKEVTTAASEETTGASAVATVTAEVAESSTYDSGKDSTNEERDTVSTPAAATEETLSPRVLSNEKELLKSVDGERRAAEVSESAGAEVGESELKGEMCVSADEEAELQQLLAKYGEEDAAGEDVTDDLLDHFDDLLADLDATTAGLDLGMDLAELEALTES